MKRVIVLALTLFLAALLTRGSGIGHPGVTGIGNTAEIGKKSKGACAVKFAFPEKVAGGAGREGATGAATAGNLSGTQKDLTGTGAGTVIPLRKVFESLGANVTWDGALRSVLVVLPDKEIRLYPGGTVLVNGRQLAVADPVQLVDGVTWITPGLIGQILEVPVAWDGHTGSFYIDGKKTPAETKGDPGGSPPAVPGSGEQAAPHPVKLEPALAPAGYQYPLWLSQDGRTLYTGLYSKTLGGSTDDLKTVTGIHTFEVYISACRELANGELLVACGNPGVPGTLWLSSGNRTTWTKVLEASSANARFTNEWSLSTHGKIAVASEYGGKTPPDNARKVYLSLDSGVTWKEILDIGQRENSHVHSCAYDPYEARIWVACGDSPNNSIHYSEDWGSTWTTVSSDLVTSIVPLPDCVLFGTHQPPNGIIRYNRAGTEKGTSPGFEYAYYIDREERNVTYCASMAFQGEPSGPVYFSFLVAGTGDKPGLIVATKDGANFYEVFRDTVLYAPGKGVINLLGPTAGGKLIGLINDDRQASYSILKAKAQIWPQSPNAKPGLPFLGPGGKPLSGTAGESAGSSRGSATTATTGVAKRSETGVAGEPGTGRSTGMADAVPALERTAQAGGGKARVPSPLKLNPAITPANFQYPMWLSGDGKTFYTGWDSNTLKKSADELKTLTAIHTFEVYLTACRDLDNGELLVACGNQGAPASLWLSSKGQTKWTKVLETSGPGARFMNEWSISVSGRIIVASEYGGKKPPDNARKVYLSRDYGKTWAEILDIGQREGTHVHGCAYDPYYNRIWVTTGDIPHQSILYSDDWGRNWQVASKQYQATSIYPLPNCVLFGTDSSPNGILRYSRAGKSNPPAVEVAFRIDNSPRLTYNAKLAFRGSQPDAPVYFPYIVKVTNERLPGLVIATQDGFNFFEIFRDSINYEVQKGVLNLLGPTPGGKLIGLLYDGRQQSYSLITADAQEWVEPE